MEFDWDPAKAAANERKHGTPFVFATAVFMDSKFVDYDVSRPDDDEPRRKAAGVIKGKLFTVVYTLRGAVVRIISARRSNLQEVRRYGVR